MSTKYSRSGGKYSGTHTTLIPAACLVADIADACDIVTKISPGFVKAGLRSVQGQRRLKIADSGSRLLLSIRDNTSHQEVHVYATDTKAAADAIARDAAAAGLAVTLVDAR